MLIMLINYVMSYHYITHEYILILCLKHQFYQMLFLVYRIGQDGRIFVEKRLKGIYVTAEKLQEARQNLVQAGKEVPIKYVINFQGVTRVCETERLFKRSPVLS